MILSEIKNYVRQRREVSLRDVAAHFDLDAEAARGMLDFWVIKGRISRQGSEASCGGGCACSYKDNTDRYQWNPQLANISIERR
jgi:hypothetical protein